MPTQKQETWVFLKASFMSLRDTGMGTVPKGLWQGESRVACADTSYPSSLHRLPAERTGEEDHRQVTGEPPVKEKKKSPI